MRAWTRPFLGVVIGALGCTSSGKQSSSSSQTSKAVAEALTSGVAFDNGKLKSGALPAATATNVMVEAASQTLSLQPNGSTLMSLVVDNPDESSDPVAATLIQFENSSSHVEVPRSKVDAGSSDGGSSSGANGKVHLDSTLTLGSDVCKGFCNTTFDVKMFMAVQLNSGKISQHGTRTFTLDCKKDGDAAKCDKDAGTKKGAAGKASTVADAGKRDASVDNSLGEMLAAAYTAFDLAVCGCGTTDQTNPYCDAAPFPKTAVECVKTQVNDNSSMACISAKVSCDVRAINALTSTCKSCGCADPNQMLGAALTGETGASCGFTLPGIDTCKLNLGDAGVKDAGAAKDAGLPGVTDAAAKDAGPCAK
jgi:hypothetical protein